MIFFCLHFIQGSNEDIGQVSGEEMAVGSIGVKLYVRFFLAGAGVILFLFFLMLNLTAQVNIGVTIQSRVPMTLGSGV